MKCTQCGARSRIIDSRPTKLGTRRRHECHKGHRKTTYEVDASMLYRMAKDVLMEPGFFMQSERELQHTVMAFVERPLKLVKTG